ncbi:MAG: VOC family protein [Halioglobus sp.]
MSNRQEKYRKRAWNMELGAFSISLAVKDLAKSKVFYEKLGFEPHGGIEEQGWLIMKNDETVIGLFQGMFESNILTLNPGWNSSANELESFTDIRELQQQMKAAGLVLDSEVDENTTGPGSIMLSDPDGNTLLIDQHR